MEASQSEQKPPEQKEPPKGIDKKAANEVAMRLVKWTKYVLSTQLLPQDAAVCEVCCTDNLDAAVGFWNAPNLPRPAQVVLTTDTATRSEALHAAWNRNGSPAHITVIDYDPAEGIWGTMTRCSAGLVPGLGDAFQGVCFFNGLGSFYQDAEAEMMLLQSVVQYLLPGGYMLGVTADSSEIWSKVVNDRREFVHKEVKRALFGFQLGNPSQEFGYYGTSLKLWLRGEDPAAVEVISQECISHFPTMIDSSARCGLTMLDMTNLHSFFEMYRKHPPSVAVLSKLDGTTAKLSAPQAELLALFSSFVFRKDPNYA